jgi:hypothetical protein
VPDLLRRATAAGCRLFPRLICPRVDFQSLY